jgi:hypothetical protein
MAEQNKKPCPYCHSIENKWGTCSWHCITCSNMKENCYKDCNYKNKEDKK